MHFFLLLHKRFALTLSLGRFYTWDSSAWLKDWAGFRHRSRENPVVTKKEIVKAISEEIGLTQLKTKEIVQKTFDAIVETLVADGRIELRNFGVFEVKKRAARKARNPRTGEKVFVAEKFVVTFKPGKEMEEKVRLLEEQAAREAEARHAAELAASAPAASNLEAQAQAPAPAESEPVSAVVAETAETVEAPETHDVPAPVSATAEVPTSSAF
jgi:integration host factor subunit beta